MRRGWLVRVGASLVLLALGAGVAWWIWQDRLAGLIGTPSTKLGAAPLEGPVQDWLISPTGGPVALADVRAYLRHEEQVPERTLTVTLVAPLSDLLQDGETLPDPVYFPVLADIRAPLLAEMLCPVLTDRLADRCTVDLARVDRDSVDLARATASFTLVLRYSQPVDANDLPDLARHVLATRVVPLPAKAGPLPEIEAVLTALLDAANTACRSDGTGSDCRVLRLSLDFAPGREARGHAVIGSLSPLPDWMRPAPELIPAPQG